jgi:hypothetical protein
MRGRLTYSIGNEHNPANPFGRSILVVEPDGAARLDQYRLGQHDCWSGIAPHQILEQLWAALDQAGFPVVVSPERLLPDTSMCSIAVRGPDGSEAVAQLEFHAAQKLPGYSEAVRLLETIGRMIRG